MSELKTVGDYKKAGLVFIDEDQCDCAVMYSKKWQRNPLCYADNNIVEFAWRTNTGEAPEFSGKIEIECSDGDVIVVKRARAINWEALDYYLKWRPHLPKSNTETPEEKEAFERMEKKSTYDVDAHVSGERDSYDKGMRNCANDIARLIGLKFGVDVGYNNLADEVATKLGLLCCTSVNEGKTVFTQEMADRGEMPPVGAEFILNYHELGSRYNDMSGSAMTVIGVNNEVYTLSSDIHGYGALALDLCNCKPIKTDREKVIDEITGEWPKACEHTIKLMHDLGYRKESK